MYAAQMLRFFIIFLVVVVVVALQLQLQPQIPIWLAALDNRLITK